MLTKKQITEIKEHLEKAQNPLFFFDNDCDGLCSFLLLQRYIGRGKGVPIKSFPELSIDYFRKVHELNADYLFVLDKAVISKEFLDEVEKLNIPLVWIDHHIDSTSKKEAKKRKLNYYNPTLKKSSNTDPVTTLCYQITNKKEDLWLAVIGSISDGYVSSFYEYFLEKYPDLGVKTKKAFEVRYNSPIGSLMKLFSFALKDKTTNVVTMLKYLMKIKTPYEVLEEDSKNYLMYKRFKEINQKYQKLLKKAKKIINTEAKVLYFEYSGDLSISQDLSDELLYQYPDRVIFVVYINGLKANISGRGKGVRKIMLKAIHGLENATGGGHEVAVGAKIMVPDLEKFKSRLLSD